MDTHFFLDAHNQPPPRAWHPQELIGNICNSGDISPPADSFPQPSLPGDPGFAERAARFSSFRSRSFNCRTTQLGSGLPPNVPAQSKPGRKLQRVLSSPSLKLENAIDIGNFGLCQGGYGDTDTGSSSRKRKAAPKSNCKSKQIPSSPAQATENRNSSIPKRIKSSEENNTNDKAAEASKDYIHVRARRGQATDSHSLAERVRREKISERMKLLQDIVPGCNKVTGKALMLEEIINYVQSLQRQVEFLSMKLASTPPPTPSIEFGNDIFQPNCSLQQISSMQELEEINIYGGHQNGSVALNQTHEMACESDALLKGACELQSLCQGDLHAIVEMGFSDDRLYSGSS